MRVQLSLLPCVVVSCPGVVLSPDSLTSSVAGVLCVPQRFMSWLLVDVVLFLNILVQEALYVAVGLKANSMEIKTAHDIIEAEDSFRTRLCTCSGNHGSHAHDTWASHTVVLSRTGVVVNQALAFNSIVSLESAFKVGWLLACFGSVTLLE